MSKGNRMIGVRVSDEEYEDILAQLAKSDLFRRGEPWTLSSFVRVAIREKLDKMARSRGKRKCKGVANG